MCLLIFCADPFILCSNRDEYFDRHTIDGSYDTNTRKYSPVDVLKGGTWIAFSGGGNSRFAVVLNFHDWRYSIFSSWDPPCDRNKLSRGHLPADFVNAPDDVSARSFAHSICPDRMDGFNLIVGDSNSCYYVSNCYNNGTPIELVRSEIHGISNGHLFDMWPKIVEPKRKIKSLIPPKCNTGVPRTNYDVNTARDLAVQLLKVMQDDNPQQDATYGWNVVALTRLSAVNVQPFSICGRMYGTRTIIIAIACVLAEGVGGGGTGGLFISEHSRCSPVANRSAHSEQEWSTKETILSEWTK